MKYEKFGKNPKQFSTSEVICSKTVKDNLRASVSTSIVGSP